MSPEADNSENTPDIDESENIPGISELSEEETSEIVGGVGIEPVSGDFTITP